MGTRIGVRAALRRWLGDYVVALVVAMVIVTPLLRINAAQWTVHRNLVLQVMGVLLLCGVLARLDVRSGARERLGRFLASGVNGPVLLYCAWALISALWVAPDGVGRAFAINDLLRLGAGVLVYLVVANHIENRRQMETMVDAVLIIVGTATLYRIFVPQWFTDAPSLLGTRLLSGAFLCLFLPVVAAAAASPLHLRRQIASRVVLILTVVTLLVTPTRSSWIGALVGMAVFGALAVRHLAGGVKSLGSYRSRAVYPVLALGGALALLLAMSDLSRQVSARARTLPAATRGEDESLQARWKQWKPTLGMIARRPVFGLGIGNYVLRQQAYTHIGRTEEEVTREGATMAEQGHNEYLHLTAELGVPGLLFYFLILLAFFAKSAHALARLPAGARKVLLIGCMSAIAAQGIDAVANPAWRYAVCSLYFWLVLGIGVALLRMAYRTPVSIPSHSRGRRGREGEVKEAAQVTAA